MKRKGPLLIRLRVPGTLAYRDLAMRVVAASCRLVPEDTSRTESSTEEDFDAEVISAFGEAFNNIAIHGYRTSSGYVDIEIDLGPDLITIRIMDTGLSFDPSAIPAPNLDELPESGMGVYIINSFMDRVSYEAASPNVLSLTKQRRARRRSRSVQPTPPTRLRALAGLKKQ